MNMRFAAPTPKTAEAAQANRGGLECSSYTWQVRRCVYAFCMAESQEKSWPHGASQQRDRLTDAPRWVDKPIGGGLMIHPETDCRDCPALRKREGGSNG